MHVVRLVPVLALIAFAVPLAAGAQTPPPPAATPGPMMGHHHGHHRHHPSLMRALRDLNLTPAQQQQVTAFRDQAKKANVNADSATKRANAAKLREQIMGILTPDQKAQLAAEMHRPAKPMTSETPPPGPAPANSPASSPN
jgi:Spy/CpxP family protein refolding chaperone